MYSMVSLTSFIPNLAPIFGMTPAALYERQRALVRLGHLPAPVGRGRGSGSTLNASTVSWIFMAVLAADNLSEMDRRVARLAQAAAAGGRCRKSGANTFRAAIQATLSQTELAQNVDVVRAVRQIPYAVISWKQDSGPVRYDTRFGTGAGSGPQLSIEAVLAGKALAEVAARLKTVGVQQ
jgi:hypothetical protein